MKSKFGYLIKYSLKKKINTKWFKVVNILLCLLLVFIINMDSVINFFGGDFNEKDKIYVVDNAGSYNSFSNYLQTLAESLDLGEYEVILDNTVLNNKDELEDKVVVVINRNATDFIDSEIVSFDTVSRSTYEVIVNSLNAVKSEMVLQTSGMSADEIARLTSPVSITETVLNEDAKDNQTKEMLSGVVTTVVIVPFFILIVTMVQMLGAEINDEKTSRGMEVIISSVPAKMHFASKVLAALSYVLIQGGLLFLYGFLGVMIRKVMVSGSDAGIGGMFSETIEMLKNAGVFDLLLKGAIPLIILFIVSFALYAVVSAVLASMTTNNEDFQQLQTPLMIIMLVGYYVALMAVVFDGAVFINVLAFVPMLSVMIAPTLYLLGEMSLVALTLTTLVTIVATYIIYHYGLRIYKVGILNYSSSKLWKKMFKSLKQK